MAKDIDFFEKILIKKFGDMPLWIRATTYLTTLLLSVYLTLCPDYIHGKIIMPGLIGGEQGYRDGQLLVFYEDQPIRFDLTEEGSFRVPVFSKLPWPPVELRVLRQDESFPVEVPILKRLMPGAVTIYGQEDPWVFSLDPPGGLESGAHTESLLSSLGIGGTALAQAATASQKPADSLKIDRTVVDIVDAAVLAAERPETAKAQVLASDPIARSLIVGALEDTYDIAIPSSDWRELKTVEAIESYLTTPGFDLRIRRILRDASGAEALYLDPAIPPKKLANAREAAAVPDSEEVLGILDATIFGSAKESMVFGRSGIYYRTSWTRGEGPRVGWLSYDEFLRRTFERVDWSEVSLGSDPRGEEDLRFVVAGADMKASALADLLNQIRAAKQLELLSATGWPASASGKGP